MTNKAKSLLGFFSWELLAQWLFLVVTCVALLFTYHTLFKQAPTRFGTINLDEVVKIREEQFVALLSKDNVSDKEREKAFEMVSSIGPEIKQGMAAIAQSCQCILLVQSAVLSMEVPDYTNDLKKHLGMK